MIAPVLAAASLSARSAMVQTRAAAIARDAGAPLHLVHVVSPLQSRRSTRSALARLHLSAARLRDQLGVKVDVSLARGGVAGAVAAKASALRARMVVMGAGRRACGVQRRVGVPVLAVQGGSHASYRRVLFAAGLSGEDETAVSWVRRQLPDAWLGVVHVFHWEVLRPLRYWFLGEELVTSYRRWALAQAAAEVRRFAARHGLPDASLESRRADVADALRLHAGERGADLLVLWPENSWLKAALGAGITRRLSANPPCDLLLAPRTPWRESAARVRREVGERLAAP